MRRAMCVVLLLACVGCKQAAERIAEATQQANQTTTTLAGGGTVTVTADCSTVHVVAAGWTDPAVSVDISLAGDPPGNMMLVDGTLDHSWTVRPSMIWDHTYSWNVSVLDAGRNQLAHYSEVAACDDPSIGNTVPTPSLDIP